MKNIENKLKRLQYECFFNQDDSPCKGVENVNIIVHKKKVKNRNKYERLKSCQQPAMAFRLSRFGTNKTLKLLKKHSSMPELTKRMKLVKQRTRSSDAIFKKRNCYLNSKFIVNRVSEYYFNQYFSPFNYPSQKKWKVYRCQLSSQEDSCCCSCNSDAMFEVMKSLYDCYKKKNCDNCNCILCGHLPREERRLGEVKKSLASVGLAGSTKERKEKVKKAEKAMKGKTKEEKEKILKELAKAGEPLPEGKTASEKAMIRRIRTEVGLPPEPKTASEKARMRKAEAAGVMTPLEGKTLSQKEKILKAQAQLGVPLPEGRTASEKALIHRIKTDAGIPEGIAAEKIKKAKAAGLVTPLTGKTAEQKEKILRGLAMEGLPLPEAKTASERKLIDKIRVELGLPPEPKTPSMREKYAEAANAGLMQPLEGKSDKEKEKILQGLADRGIPLPEGRTASEKKLIAKVKARAAPPDLEVAPSERIRRAKAAGVLTPLEGKTPEQKEKILRGLAMQGLPLPEARTASERKLAEKVRADLGLPPEPKTPSLKEKHVQAAKAGLMQPLEGKSTKEKEKILQGLHDMGIPLPEGRTASEKALIAKVKAGPRAPTVAAPSEKIRKAKAAGLLTPLEGKSPEQKEKILRGLAMQGIPLPEGKTASERKLIDKVRVDLGLPPEPKTASMRGKYARAADAGLLQPLEGKSAKEKEKILQGLHDMGIPLPEGRTASEKAIIAKVKAGPRAPSVAAPSEKLRKAKAAGLLTPLEGKSPEQKEKILRGLAMQGIPLPEGKTASERKLIDKVRVDLGLPPEPKTASMRGKYARAADVGLLQPLEGKSAKEKEKILQGLHDMGIPLPEGRTASEKALIAKVKAGPRAPTVAAPSEQMRKAKAAGLLTPLEGKSPEQKEKILRGLAMQGIPLPEGKTASERKLIDKVRVDLGLPPEPKTASMRGKYARAADAGLLQPLEGKSAKEKEKILQGLHDMGIPLPEGRTASEKAIIAKVKAGPRAPTVAAPSEKMRKAKAAGLLTPLEGKSPEQKEKILRGLAMQGIPLPEGKTASEKKLIDKVRADLGLPPEPKTASMRDKYAKAAEAGLLQPLEGKSATEKEKILQGLHDKGIPLPEGRTASEKAIIAKVKAGPRAPSAAAPSEKLRKAKAAGLLTPLADKSPAQREKILRGLAMQGVPLPEAKTASEKMLIDKVRADLGLPPEPKTPSMREKYTKAADAGFLQPLEGKTPKEKERILQGLHDMGIPLPEGRTASEKALINKVKAGARAPSAVSEKLRKAKAAGLLTPLEGKSPAQKEKIIRGLAMQGLPLPEGKTASERKLIHKVRADLGLPPEPKTPSMKEKYAKAANAGLMQPLEGKSTKEKEKILQGLHDMGIPLPEGRTASEKALIAKVKAGPRAASIHVPSEKMRKAQAAGLLTPLEGKTAAQQEKILRGLAMQGIPLPEGKTASEKRLADKVRVDLGLPPAPKTAADREKYNKAVEAGLIIPLEGKSTEEKEKILRGQHDLGLPLPEGRTASEKSLIRKIKAGERRKTRAVGIGQPPLPPDQRRKLDEKTAKVVKEGKGPADECICGLLTPESEREPIKAAKIPSDKIRAAKAAGLLTPLEGKTPEQKEKILKGLVKQGLPLPEGKTASERKLIDKVRADLGLPPEPKTPSMKEKYARAQEKGLITPLEGKTASQKEKILRGQAEMGLPLPVGRTASEKALIAKIKGSAAPSITTEKLRKAKAAGLLTPLEGKSPEQQEKILRGLAKSGLPLPEGKTASEKALIKKIKTDLGIPERTQSEKIRRAKTAGLLTPLEGKSKSQKEKILRGRAAAGLPLPVGKTQSERALIQKIKDETGYVTPSPSERLRRAKTAGLLTPLEGKTAAEKEKIIRERIAAGVPIAEGKTPSEKEIIRKVTAGEPPAVKRPSEKERQAKAAGLLTPLEGKTPEQKEKILRGLVKAGVPMPEPKSASERDLMNKIRQDVGLPPEPKTPSLKEKYKKAQAAGIITPLEGKTPAEKEKILRKLHDAGIPLPEGRTPSEKSMVKRIKAGLPERKTPSDKIKAAKAAGLLTPLEGKTHSQKEKIIKELAKAGLPIPEPKTASEKDMIKKVRTEIGLPPEPATASAKERMQRAQAAGIITPLEGKTHEEKEKILKGLAEAGVALPEARTASEKAIISKLKAESKARTKITPEKLKKAKEAGLLTPLAGKSAKEKERIMKGLIEQGLPLPEAQTASEKKIAEKVRKEFGLPPEPKTSAERIKMRKAQAAGLITPLEGKTVAQKEKILRGLAEAGIPLPEGRTASERSLIKKIKGEEGRPPPKGRVGPPALPPAERAKLDKKTAKVMKEGKGPSDECICGLLTPESEREEVPIKIPSEKLKKAKAAGVLTPLEGKTTAQKEKILRGLAKEGIPLPEAKTASEKKLTEKIRKELGLPPEPKTASIREKHEKAAAAGVLIPLEGLSPAEKERVLRAQADLGIPLPEGRTASEKALIAKVKAESKGPPAKIPSEKLRKAKAAGVLTPLEGKTTAQKEKILRGLAKEGIPLPEAKTASEKKLTEKIRKELGLPPEPKTASIREKHEKAAAAGVLIPLEGLSPAEKERVLRAQADLGIPLPEGRTASEKALIAKVKAESKGPPAKIPSEKLRKAKAAGVLTPLEGKTTAQKEKILRGLAKEGIPLPEAKTASEKKLTEKIRKELGLPPEPKTASIREKHEKAAAAGVLIPLEGLSPAEKERVLRAQADLGIPLPEGRTASEKVLIAKVKAESKGPPAKIPSEKLRKAKAAGLMTPLEGKTTAQKEKILRGLAKEGIPLPEAKTSSEKKLTEKIRKELGLPPEPKTASIREKHEKAAAAGVLVPLEGLSPAEKERILRAQADLGIPLPEGRTASEKALIAKVKAESKGPPEKIPSEKLRKAKAAGLMTPLEGKTTAQKEKILRGLAKEGIPLPEAKTSSEKKITEKIRKELGLPPEPKTASMREKHEKAAAAGVLVPLEGLSPAEKERVLRAQAELGIPLPEGRTASEKALIAKVKAEGKGPPEKIPSEKLRKAKAAGLLTPLEGKTTAQKEKILRGLAKEGIPLPEAKTSSEKKITEKIRKELGLPPEPQTASMREKHEKAAAAGVLKPLEGLSQEEKKRVLRGQANLGIPLPEGRTASEKALIAKIKSEQEPSKVSSEKLRKAKAAGLLTPLEGKTKSQKEKIIKSLAEAGLPMPEGKTESEKVLIQKIRTELGIPPPAKTASEKSVVRKAKAEGLLTPLAGKSAKEKERIVKGLIDAGLPVPEGKTASEKELIRKVRTAAGLPPEKTASEKKVGIKTKSKKVGVTPSKRRTKSIAAKAGIREEYEDIIKTTTCDRGCGCDKKKIRFKHSYVKIRVTSPDISSLCPCPDECLPGVKAGAFIDNEGIKVTVGRVDGVTSYTTQFSNHILESPQNIETLFDKKVTNSFSSNSSIDSVDTLFENIVSNDLHKATRDDCPSNKYFNNYVKPDYDLTSFSYTSGCYDSHASLKTYNIESDRGYLYECKSPYEQWTDESDRFLDTSKYLQSSEAICRNPAPISCTSCECLVMEESSRGSFDSILVIKSESSLSLSTKSSGSMDVISVISLTNSSCASESTHYIYYPASNIHHSNSTVETSECFTNRIDYTDIDCIGIDTVTSSGSNNQVQEARSGMHVRNREDGTIFSRRKQNAYLTYRLSQTKLGNIHNVNQINTRETGEPIIVINNLDSDQDITTMVDQLLSNNEFSNRSSIFVVVPTSDDNDSDTSSGSLSSTICIQLSEHHSNWARKQYNRGISEAVPTSRRDSSTTRGLKISSRGKNFFMEGVQQTVSSIHKEKMLYKIPHICRHKEIKKSKNKLCQISSPKEVLKKKLPHGVSTDTTSDRPCCCAPKRADETHHKHGSEHRCVANVVSELISPLLVSQGLNCDTLRLPKISVNQQASFVSINRGPTPVTTCHIPPCAGQTGCHLPSDMLQIPFGTPMPEPVPEPKQSQPCQCSPEKLRQLLEQAVKTGKTLNLKSVGCGGAVDKLPALVSAAPDPTTPYSTSLSEDCATCSKPEHKDGLKMQCSCSGKKRTIKLRPLCPCEQHQPPVSKTVPGPKAGTRSLGGQCCVCNDSQLCGSRLKGKLGIKMGHMEVVGPSGGMVLMEPGGTYTQAGLKNTQTKTSIESSSTSKKNCACHGKNGKRKNNVICECPPPEPEPEPEPQPEPEVMPIILSFEQYKSYQMEETRQVMKMRSDMTQTQSGFRMFKKKKPPPEPEVEFTLEDAVRYYARMNPDLVRDLVPPPQEFRGARDYEDCSCDEKKRKKTEDVDCECPYEPPPPPPPPPPEPEPEPEPEEPFRGLKFTMGGKGSGSKGLSGVCCFEMFQETSRSRSTRSIE